MDDGQLPAPDGAVTRDYADASEYDGNERNAVVAPDLKHDEKKMRKKSTMNHLKFSSTWGLDVAGLRITGDGDDGNDASTAALSFTPASAWVIAGRTIAPQHQGAAAAAAAAAAAGTKT